MPASSLRSERTWVCVRGMKSRRVLEAKVDLDRHFNAMTYSTVIRCMLIAFF